MTDFIYDGFGSNTKVNDVYGVLQIQDYKLLVGKQEKKYDLITTEGVGLFRGFILDDVYIEDNSGVKNYYIKYGEQKIELIKFLEDNNVTKPTK